MNDYLERNKMYTALASSGHPVYEKVVERKNEIGQDHYVCVVLIDKDNVIQTEKEN